MNVPIPTTGVTSMKQRIDLMFALCVLLGVVVVLMAGFHHLGVDIQIPVISSP